MEAAKEERLHALYCLATMLGPRQRELLGLRWRDVDLETGVLHIRRSLKAIKGQGLVLGDTKTALSRRPLALPRFVAEALLRHRVGRAEERLRAGALWEDNDLIFPTQTGRPLNASYVVESSFHRVCTKAGIPFSTRTQRGLRFHDLRHSTATVLRALGFPDRVIMEILGHSNIAMTSRYEHVPDEVMFDVAKRLDEVFG